MRLSDSSLTRRRIAPLATVVFVSLLGLGLAGCGANASAPENSGTGASSGPSSSGVGQGGAQDFGRFRGLVESGEVPAPETLDPVGFFNEHKFDLPDPDCGEDVCLHGMFGVQANMINGSNCTNIAIGFNTRRTPDSFKRPPLNLAIAVDVSGSMKGRPIDEVKRGLKKMTAELEDEDRVTLVPYSSEASIARTSTPENDPDRSKLEDSIDNLQANGSTNIYNGLKKAFQIVEDNASDDRQNRVMLLSDGRATEGIERRERIVNLAESYSVRDYGLTAIGIGSDFDLQLMRELGRGGANNFYFLEDPSSVQEVFVEEVQTFLVPLAEEVDIRFEGTEAYNFRAAYGTRHWTGDAQSAKIDIPALFMASRQSSEEVGPGGGRRGGGGIILLELVPTTDEDVLENTPPDSEVGTISMTYEDPRSDDVVDQEVTPTNPLKPDAAPEQGKFTSPTVEKAFVALNVFAGFRMATRRSQRRANAEALNLLEPLRDNVGEWHNANPDKDIKADLQLMDQLIDLIEERTVDSRQRIERRPANPWPRGD